MGEALVVIQLLPVTSLLTDEAFLSRLSGCVRLFVVPHHLSTVSVYLCRFVGSLVIIIPLCSHFMSRVLRFYLSETRNSGSDGSR